MNYIIILQANKVNQPNRRRKTTADSGSKHICFDHVKYNSYSHTVNGNLPTSGVCVCVCVLCKDSARIV